jgi:hypothetical protein
LIHSDSEQIFATDPRKTGNSEQERTEKTNTSDLCFLCYLLFNGHGNASELVAAKRHESHKN